MKGLRVRELDKRNRVWLYISSKACTSTEPFLFYQDLFEVELKHLYASSSDLLYAY